MANFQPKSSIPIGAKVEIGPKGLYTNLQPKKCSKLAPSSFWPGLPSVKRA